MLTYVPISTTGGMGSLLDTPRGVTRSLVGATVLLVGLVQSAAVLSSQEVVAPLADRARGAERIVVGRVSSVAPVWRVNDFGDRLIVSIVSVAVDETLKGPPQPSVQVEVEGGTIGDVTLRVSDLASFVPGDRAVFYLSRSPRGVFVPHLRGQGLLKLDRQDRVPGSSLTLDEIRRTVAAANR
ncbi:MAG TPA: hypothetical protein VM818_06980 [Vicinamibacterales bacterium]|jgi:hypothetical protein|nr:hypothetical protein [Vicinamibacterales bacterium]